MATTRQAAKRARLELKRRENNRRNRSATKTNVKEAVKALLSKDVEKAKASYLLAIKSLARSASNGSIPHGRAARKTSRLTQMARKLLPEALPFKATALTVKAPTAPKKKTSGTTVSEAAVRTAKVKAKKAAITRNKR